MYFAISKLKSPVLLNYMNKYAELDSFKVKYKNKTFIIFGTSSRTAMNLIIKQLNGVKSKAMWI